MKEFFAEDILLEGESAKALYEEVKDLPIVDYHCHLNPKQIAEDFRFEDIGELWLAGDHYKWRAMRMCGIDEYYITGAASWKEKFVKYAQIMPKLIGGPLYYWTHFELRQIFGIELPLGPDTAEQIYRQANERMKDVTVSKLLKQYKVETVCTTDDPADDLTYHGTHGDTLVLPTFRPDKLCSFQKEYYEKLGGCTGRKLESLSDLQAAVCERMDYFCEKGCRISDHAFEDFPKAYATEEEAETIFVKMMRGNLTETEQEAFRGYLLVFLMREYKKRNLIVQLHFSSLRNVNTPMYRRLGVDAGYDVINNSCNVKDMTAFLDKLSDEERPQMILYTLNPNDTSLLACVSGAYRNVLVGAAWWMNDTLSGIRRHLDVVSEYACLGTNLGMLTDSRAFSSYSRFDFFRRILCTFVGKKVDAGEYDQGAAKALVRDISYFNVKELLRV